MTQEEITEMEHDLLFHANRAADLIVEMSDMEAKMDRLNKYREFHETEARVLSVKLGKGE